MVVQLTSGCCRKTGGKCRGIPLRLDGDNSILVLKSLCETILVLCCAAAGAKSKKGGKKGGKGIEMSLQLKHVASGLGLDVLRPGLGLPAVVKTVEDHGYVLGFGVKVRGVTGRLAAWL